MALVEETLTQSEQDWIIKAVKENGRPKSLRVLRGWWMGMAAAVPAHSQEIERLCSRLHDDFSEKDLQRILNERRQS